MRRRGRRSGLPPARSDTSRSRIADRDPGERAGRSVPERGRGATRSRSPPAEREPRAGARPRSSRERASRSSPGWEESDPKFKTPVGRGFRSFRAVDRPARIPPGGRASPYRVSLRYQYQQDEAETFTERTVDARRGSVKTSSYNPEMPSPTSVIRGSGVFLPDGVVTNERMSRLMDTTDEWIQQRTGIRERRYARKGTSSADLGAEAAKAALADAGLPASDVDLILFATMTPAHYFPGNGGIAAAK